MCEKQRSDDPEAVLNVQMGAWKNSSVNMYLCTAFGWRGWLSVCLANPRRMVVIGLPCHHGNASKTVFSYPSYRFSLQLASDNWVSPVDSCLGKEMNGQGDVSLPPAWWWDFFRESSDLSICIWGTWVLQIKFLRHDFPGPGSIELISVTTNMCIHWQPPTILSCATLFGSHSICEVGFMISILWDSETWNKFLKVIQLKMEIKLRVSPLWRNR